MRWSFGSVNGATWPQDGIVALFVTVCSLVLILLAPKINVMMMGDDVLAKSMGIRTDFLRSVILIVSVLMTAAIISYTGVIGFVGLIAPHIGRRLIGEDNRYLIPFSGIIGGVLLLLSDIIGRSVMAPAILPVMTGKTDLGKCFFSVDEGEILSIIGPNGTKDDTGELCSQA